jgi:hypothetical protein
MRQGLFPRCPIYSLQVAREAVAGGQHRERLRCVPNVPKGKQDHGGIPVAIAASTLIGGSHETLHLLRREVLARPDVSVAAPGRWYCPI